ncbi:MULTISPECIES: PadR family transcriptional regulator [Paenibacillus]|uniref:PadR family transcriptional regulator n=1 Tax=Paenibacillus pabuli TaxID=1472 RepID=A0A855YBZ8_9BACL|nr:MULTISPECIES: PadR family transcriptional regulator [Paenibacillus]PWW42211.1 PadR family transcriptional regulator [Paenibacillus pabuli]PXW07599.1 PadR family transcriptional regulator [Paenibacillus taichungensis]RAI94638.1 PadR family transcriptional regulator [Paenibacillus pabuli]
MNTQHVILGILHNQPCSGYEIKQYFEQYFSFFFDASFGTIYPTLAKMEKSGLLTKESVRQEGKPDKNVYTLTPEGAAEFNTYLMSPLEAEVFRSDFLMRLYFGELADEETVEGWVRSELNRKEGLYAELQRQMKQFGEHISPAQRLCMQVGLVQYEATIRLLKEQLTAPQ